MRRNRSSFSFPDFSLRRLLLQGARAARGSPTLGNRCDIEKGTSSSSKTEKSSSTTSNKVSSVFEFFASIFLAAKFISCGKIKKIECPLQRKNKFSSRLNEFSDFFNGKFFLQNFNFFLLC